MNQSLPKIIELREYQQLSISAEDFDEKAGFRLYQEFGSIIDVTFPSLKTGNQWQFSSLGYVGYLPLTDQYHFSLLPKVSLSNLFQMLEYAYQLPIQWLEETYRAESLSDYYERIVRILANKVLDRAQKGFYKEYINYQEPLTTVRGRLNATQTFRRPWDIDFHCEYENHTLDIPANQILAWTLWLTSRSGFCSHRTRPAIRTALHSLLPAVSLEHFDSLEDISVSYNHLNEDYKPMHHLCRFLLDNLSPDYRLGDTQMLPFLVNMHRLFEKFVAQWMKMHAVEHFSVVDQVPIYFGTNAPISFTIDLLLRDPETLRPLMVLDTKYKTPDKPSTSDIQQVVAYAEAMDCTEAVLIYPQKLAQPLNIRIGEIRVRSLAFPVTESLDQAGQKLLAGLLNSSPV